MARYSRPEVVMRMRVLALTFGDRDCASTYYRVVQYVETLRALDVDLEWTPAGRFEEWSRLAAYDAVLVQKRLFPVWRVRQIRRAARRLVYDIDDAIWHPHTRPHHWFTRWRTSYRLAAVVRKSDLVLAANEVLASRLRQIGARVETTPMVLDAAQWPPRSASMEASVRVGWSGAPGNLRYLESIEQALLRALVEAPRIELAVFCGQAPGFARLGARHIPYEHGKESSAVRTFDIGLLPLPDDPFAAAKSPIKGLQYMASGVATIASPRAAVREMFAHGETARFASTMDEWAEAIVALVQDRDRRRKLSAAARKRFETSFSLLTQAPLVASRLTGRPGNAAGPHQPP